MSDKELFPLTLPGAEHIWATKIPRRSPEFKAHATEGLANNAMGQRSPDESYAKYKFENGVWNRVFLYVPPSECSDCGKALSRRGGGHRMWGFKPTYSAPVVCDDCYYR